MNINYVYNDEYLLIVNKPSGIVVHPGAGNYNGTLVDIIRYRNKLLNKIPNFGLINRIDKNTSGMVIFAKNEKYYFYLKNQIKKSKIIKEYIALVKGSLISGGIIKNYIKRDIKNRFKMSVSYIKGKYSITKYRIIKKFKNFTLLRVSLITGRKHQIRVHMDHIGYPIVGDPLYGRNIFFYKNFKFSRQALHSFFLKINHPKKKIICLKCCLPKDMIQLIKVLSSKKNNF